MALIRLCSVEEGIKGLIVSRVCLSTSHYSKCMVPILRNGMFNGHTHFPKREERLCVQMGAGIPVLLFTIC